MIVNQRDRDNCIRSVIWFTAVFKFTNKAKKN